MIKHSARVSLVDSVRTRDGSGAKDALLKNCYVQKELVGGEGENSEFEHWIVKRPGLKKVDDTATATFRGSYYWAATGKSYWVVGNKVYTMDGAETVATLAGTLNDSTGRVHFTEHESSANKLVITDADNNEVYTINTSGTQVILTDWKSAINTNLKAGCASIDGYILLPGGTNGMFLLNSETAFEAIDQINFTDGDVIHVQLYPGFGVRLTRHLNYAAMFTDKAIEFFYNAGNSPSILGRADGTVQQVGTLWPDTVVNYADTMFFLAHTTHGVKVAMLNGLTLEYISTTPLEKILTQTVNGLDASLGFMLDCHGEILYVLRLPGLSKTYAYCVKTGLWIELTYDSGTEGDFTFWGGIFQADNGRSYVCHDTTGEIFQWDDGTYQDDSNTMNVEIRTGNIDHATSQTKFCHYLSLVGDRWTATSNVTYSHSSDDYKNFVAKPAIDSQQRLVWRSCGSYVNRSHKFVHTANTPFRVKALDFGLGLGTYSQGSL